ncbi:GNAT family N-acetyltransferase [Aliiroseovarius sediminis]|uniref:GNAT family N-acetyltransferase n=1 Tax=Aliiroseovarius sediminis TaxID=2925839 RepID=UPI001F596CC8|nr:GNAT family N-acetyltransferase [Aliiroseovarius sediminis]MCI2393165.1 GNAT family N-acetyltransferase [Aliiroseovarius sediminis]
MGTSDDISVRPVTPSDRAAWNRLWGEYLSIEQVVLEPQIHDATFARLVSGTPNEFNGLLACKGNRPVGFAHFLFHRHTWKVEDVCYLQDLYTDPLARGIGVGRALIKAVYDTADHAGAPSVYWITHTANESAQKLYDLIGVKTPFIRYGRA